MIYSIIHIGIYSCTLNYFPCHCNCIHVSLYTSFISQDYTTIVIINENTIHFSYHSHFSPFQNALHYFVDGLFQEADQIFLQCPLETAEIKEKALLLQKKASILLTKISFNQCQLEKQNLPQTGTLKEDIQKMEVERKST